MSRVLHPGRSPIASTLTTAALCTGLLVLPGCVAYPYGAPAATYPSTFDRAFDAALGAMAGQGLKIVTQERASGVIVGQRGSVSLRAGVQPQADGSTRVSFNQSGPPGAEPELVQQVVADYNRRMGR